MEKNRRRERKREREREIERERESVVNGEQRGVSEWFQSGFRPLFVLISYLSIGEKPGKNEKRKKRREKETETKKKSWDGEQEDVSNLFQASFGACYGLPGYLVLNTSKRRLKKDYTWNTCGPERRAAVRKSKHPKRTLIGEIAVWKNMQRSGKASIQNAL